MLSLCDSTFVFQISAQYTTRQKSNSLLCLLCLFVALVVSVGICVSADYFGGVFVPSAVSSLPTALMVEAGPTSEPPAVAGGQVVMFGGGAEN